MCRGLMPQGAVWYTQGSSSHICTRVHTSGPEKAYGLPFFRASVVEPWYFLAV
uniref:Uncharacterized protein n=1 Tax=Anguilla anguilla TaxID=7936 RepID=A0A0E9XRW0_ANGAN